MRDFFRRHPRLATLARCGVMFVVTLLLVEMGLRVAGVKTLTARLSPPRDPADLHPLEFVAQAQRMGWIPWPKTRQRIDPVPEHPRGYIEIVRNAESCREDAATPLEKPAGMQRVLTLGDSHTDGMCFNDENLASCLEQATAQFPVSGRIEGVNAAFGPSSPYQQLWAYEQVYRRFQPDVLVVVYYAGNDLLELLRDDDRVHLERRDGQFVHAEPTAAADVTRTTHPRWEAFRQFFRDRSTIYAALTDIPQLRRLARRTVSDTYRERLERALENHSAPVWQGLNQAYLFKHQPARREAAAEQLRFVLDRFRQVTSEDGTQFTLVILPTLRMIQPDIDSQGLAESIETLELSPDDLAADDQACELALQLAAELGIRHLDLREPFRVASQADPQHPLYYRFDHHLTPRGQREIAKLLLELWTEDQASGGREPVEAR